MGGGGIADEERLYFRPACKEEGWDSGIGEDLFLLIAVDSDALAAQEEAACIHHFMGQRKGQSIGTETWAGIWGFLSEHSHTVMKGHHWLRRVAMRTRGHVKTAGIE